MKVTCGLFVIYQMVDSGMVSADGARRTLLHVNSTELHGLGIEGQQTVGQQLPYPGEIFQCLGCLDGTQHTCDSTQYAGLRTGRNDSYGRRLLEEATVAGRARQMGKRLSVEAQDATMRERFACHHASIIDKKLHGKVVGTVHNEVVLLDDVQRIRRVE